MDTMIRLMALSSGKSELTINGVNIPVYITNIEHESRMYGPEETTFTCMALNTPKQLDKAVKTMQCIPSIDRVIFNNPATIVLWADGTKTVVKAQSKEEYDPEKGIAMAIAKRALGNKGNYYNTIKKFLPSEGRD